MTSLRSTPFSFANFLTAGFAFAFPLEPPPEDFAVFLVTGFFTSSGSKIDHHLYEWVIEKFLSFDLRT